MLKDSHSSRMSGSWRIPSRSCCSQHHISFLSVDEESSLIFAFSDAFLFDCVADDDALWASDVPFMVGVVATDSANVRFASTIHDVLVNGDIVQSKAAIIIIPVEEDAVLSLNLHVVLLGHIIVS
jgi:hypothetical protein